MGRPKKIVSEGAPKKSALSAEARELLEVLATSQNQMLATLFKETMPQMVAAVVTSVKQAEAAAWQARQPKAPGPRCQKCGQFEVACKGEHREAIVYPIHYRQKWAKFFPGVWLNGQKYLSSRPGHFVTVPADFYPEVDTQRWEQNEVDMAEGRQAEFNSGVLSGTGSSTTFQADARAGWRS